MTTTWQHSLLGALNTSDRPQTGTARSIRANIALNDLQLVELAKAGDPIAFRHLVERYQKRYMRLHGVVKNEEDALDMTQDAFVKVHDISDGLGTSSFYTWLYRIVVNLCIDHVRKASRAGTTDYDDGINHHSGADISSGRFAGVLTRSPSEELKNKELGSELTKALDALSEKHRQVLVLREIRGSLTKRWPICSVYR